MRRNRTSEQCSRSHLLDVELCGYRNHLGVFVHREVDLGAAQHERQAVPVLVIQQAAERRHWPGILVGGAVWARNTVRSLDRKTVEVFVLSLLVFSFMDVWHLGDCFPTCALLFSFHIRPESQFVWAWTGAALTATTHQLPHCVSACHSTAKVTLRSDCCVSSTGGHGKFLHSVHAPGSQVIGGMND